MHLPQQPTGLDFDKAGPSNLKTLQGDPAARLLGFPGLQGLGCPFFRSRISRLLKTALDGCAGRASTAIKKRPEAPPTSIIIINEN